jgi:hypothetical protein
MFLLQGVDHWKKFYAEHKDYFKVGRVSHPPIDPASPVPEHCNPKIAGKDEGFKRRTKESVTHSDAKNDGKVVKHEEL